MGEEADVSRQIAVVLYVVAMASVIGSFLLEIPQASMNNGATFRCDCADACRTR